MTSPSSFPPLSVDELLLFLASLSDQQFAEILDEVRSPRAFEADADRVADIAARIDASEKSIGFILTFVEFLYDNIVADGDSDAVRLQTINRLVAAVEFKEPETESQKAIVSDRLARLTADNKFAKIRRKIERLKKGFLPNAVAFSTFVDVRPMISEDRASIDSFIPMVQLRISTTQGDDESSTVVQLDEKALSKLLEAIEDASKKLRLVKSNDLFKSRIVS